MPPQTQRKYSRYRKNHTNTTKPSKLLFDLISLLSLATDAVRAGLNGRRIYAILGAVVKKHTELKGRLPGPPVAILVLATELVTPFGILSHFEVKGIFLGEKSSLILATQNFVISLGIIFSYLALAVHVAFPGLRDVHLPILDFGNLYWVRKIQHFKEYSFSIGHTR